jgi:hypothetical protein
MIEPVVVRNWREGFLRYKAGIEAKHSAEEIVRKGLLAHYLADYIETRTGLKLSAQASPYHSCSLNKHTNPHPFTLAVDAELLNFEIMIYVEDALNFVLPGNLVDCTETPGGWLPIDMLESLIEQNGGWVKDALPPPPTTTNVINDRPRVLEV